MNSTNIRHGVISIGITIITLILAYFITHVYLLCFTGALFFLGREQTHAELQIKSAWGEKEITDAITLESLKIWKWETDTLMDFVVPLVCSALMCGVLYLWGVLL